MTNISLSEEIAYNANLWIANAKAMQRQIDNNERDRSVLIQELKTMADKVRFLQEENDRLQGLLMQSVDRNINLEIENQILVDELNSRTKTQAEDLSKAMGGWMDELSALQAACEYIDALAEDAFSYNTLIMEMTGEQEPWSKSYMVYRKLPQVVKDKLKALTDRRHEQELEAFSASALDNYDDR